MDNLQLTLTLDLGRARYLLQLLGQKKAVLQDELQTVIDLGNMIQAQANEQVEKAKAEQTP
jgi:hypothetical protein